MGGAPSKPPSPPVPPPPPPPPDHCTHCLSRGELCTCPFGCARPSTSPCVPPEHPDVVCKRCFANPIVGARYACTVCFGGYNMCGECYYGFKDRELHHKEHLFGVFPRPDSRGRLLPPRTLPCAVCAVTLDAKSSRYECTRPACEGYTLCGECYHGRREHVLTHPFRRRRPGPAFEAKVLPPRSKGGASAGAASANEPSAARGPEVSPADDTYLRGRTYTITGTSRADLNGTHVTVANFLAGNGRREVVLPSGEHLGVRFEHLVEV